MPKTTHNLVLGLKWALSIGALAVSLAFASKGNDALLCERIELDIQDEGFGLLVIQEDLEKLVKKTQGEIVGIPLKTINSAMLEETIEANPFVENAEVFSTLNGEVNITVSQRKPVARIFEPSGNSYYLDSRGLPFPCSLHHSPAVPLVAGSKGGVKNEIVHGVLTKWNERTALEGMLTGMRMGPKGLEITLRNTPTALIVGDTNALDEKLSVWEAFLTGGPDQTTWKNYSTIDLRFHHQVVATKPE